MRHEIQHRDGSYDPTSGLWLPSRAGMIAPPELGGPQPMMMSPGPFVGLAGLHAVHGLGGSGGGSAHPNEPSGYSQITNRYWSQVSTSSVVEGWWHSYSEATISVETDATAPKSPTSVGRHTYPNGFTGGKSGGNTGVSSPPTVSEFYIHTWTMLSSNFQGHSTGTNKHFFCTKPGSGGNPFFTSFEGTDLNSLYYTLRNQGTGTSPDTSNNLTSVEFTRNVWHDIEIVIVSNSVLGAYDGEAHLWVDGTKTAEHTDICWFDTGSTYGFDAFKRDPTWGGAGDTVSPSAIWLQDDHTYISGISV